MKALFFSPGTGFPQNEDSHPKFYAVQLHVTNKEKVVGVSYMTSIQLYLSKELQKNEVALLVIGHLISPQLLIPPNSTSFTVAGHCSADCTSKAFPKDGINVFSAFLHSHLPGRSMTLRHFRPNANGTMEELKWVSKDDNYNFNQQKTRPIQPFLKFLPGDRFTFECVYDNTWLSPLRVTTGGFPTTSEMCMAFLLFYPKLNNRLDLCASQQFGILPTQFGVTNFDMSGDEAAIAEPVELKDQNYDLHVTKMANWTKEFVEEVQEKSRYGEHMGFCQRGGDLMKDGIFTIDYTLVEYGVQYPVINKIYRPADTCPLMTS